MSSMGWIGVDLDGTLAHYEGWRGVDHIGAPVPLMLDRVKKWRAEGKTVKIFTARVYLPIDSDLARQNEVIRVHKTIAAWCLTHIGEVLEVTCTKDYSMVQLWDDRAVQVIPNTGIRADGVEG